MKYLIIIVFSVLLITPQVFAQPGPILLIGLDTEHGERPGSNDHGSIDFWASIISKMLVKVHNNKQDILVVSENPSTSPLWGLWQQVGAVLGRNIHYAGGRRVAWFFDDYSRLRHVNFENYALVIRVTEMLGGTFIQGEHDILVSRKNDIKNFICNGGGWFASASDDFSYLSLYGDIKAQMGNLYNNITVTSDATQFGFDDMNADFSNWHENFTTFPPAFSILATADQGTKIAAIGTLTYGIAMPILELNKNIFCAGEPIIADGSKSVCTEKYFWSLQKSDPAYNRIGPEISGWYGSSDKILNIGNFAKSKNFNI